MSSNGKVSRLRLFFRLTRVQFLPVMIAPIVLGLAVSWFTSRALHPVLTFLVLTGSVSLHLAANSIDDVYDFVNGLSFEVIGRDVPAGFFQIEQVDVGVSVEASTDLLRRVICDRVFRTSIRLRNAS